MVTRLEWSNTLGHWKTIYYVFQVCHCGDKTSVKGGVGTFEKPSRDTLFVIFHGMLLTSR